MSEIKPRVPVFGTVHNFWSDGRDWRANLTLACCHRADNVSVGPLNRPEFYSLDDVRDAAQLAANRDCGPCIRAGHKATADLLAAAAVRAADMRNGLVDLTPTRDTATRATCRRCGRRSWRPYYGCEAGC